MTCACRKELSQQKAASPGTVQLDETIVYVLIDPLQVRDGEVQKSAFSHSSLRNGDLSVCRANHSSAQDIHKHVVGPILARDKSRRLVGALRALCSAIRNLRIGEPPEQAICVIDDGYDDFPAHAHLAYSEVTKAEGFWERYRNARQALRGNLLLAFNADGGPRNLAECCARD